MRLNTRLGRLTMCASELGYVRNDSSARVVCVCYAVALLAEKTKGQGPGLVNVLWAERNTTRR